MRAAPDHRSGSVWGPMSCGGPVLWSSWSPGGSTRSAWAGWRLGRWWSFVAAEDPGAVRGRRFAGAVGVEFQGPPFAVDQDMVVEETEVHEVGDAGAAVVAPVDDVVRFAFQGGAVA